MEDTAANQSKKEQAGADMEPINEFDQNHFYDHDKIGSDAFSEDIRSNEDLVYQEISGTASLADRIEEERKLAQKQEHPHGEPRRNEPTKADGETLLNVGRAPDS